MASTAVVDGKNPFAATSLLSFLLSVTLLLKETNIGFDFIQLSYIVAWNGETDYISREEHGFLKGDAEEAL